MFKIRSRFYVIYGDGKPIYVGFTSRTVHQRFVEHKRNKDFSDFDEVEVKELKKDELDLDFSWDYDIIENEADEVSKKEAELVEKFGTQGSEFQKANGGGVVWTHIKYFVLSDKDNPKYRKMNGKEIHEYLENRKKEMIILNDFVENIEYSSKRVLDNFVRSIEHPSKFVLKSFITNIKYLSERILNDFVGHVEYPSKVILRNFIGNVEHPSKIILHGFIGSVKYPSKVILQGSVGSIEYSSKIILKRFVGSINYPSKIILNNLVGHVEYPSKAILKNFVGHIQHSSKVILNNFVGGIKIKKEK